MKSRERSTERAHSLLYSESEIESMLVEAIVNELLEMEHKELMLSLRKKALEMLQPFDETDLRHIVGMKVTRPFEVSLLDTIAATAKARKDLEKAKEEL